MKRMMMGMAAGAVLLGATPALAGSLNIGIFAPAPVVYQPAPVYYAPPRPVVAYAPAPVYYAVPRGQGYRHAHRHRDRWDGPSYQLSYWDGPRGYRW